MMNAIDNKSIINSIYKDGKLIHWACSEKWYDKHNLSDIYTTERKTHRSLACGM